MKTNWTNIVLYLLLVSTAVILVIYTERIKKDLNYYKQIELRDSIKTSQLLRSKDSIISLYEDSLSNSRIRTYITNNNQSRKEHEKDITIISTGSGDDKLGLWEKYLNKPDSVPYR
jgi:cbb3-type cytochrome oxidase subunit 3